MKNQGYLFPIATVIERRRSKRRVIACASCLRPVLDDRYCSDLCEIRDAEWFRLRQYRYADDDAVGFEVIGARLGITAKQARLAYRTAMRKVKAGLARLGVVDFEECMVAGMLASAQDYGDLH